MAKTTITAIPSPIAVDIFFDIAMNVHIPKKKGQCHVFDENGLNEYSQIMFHHIASLY